jgi:methylated-DNA-[protein]-cysteine S-methyltransferase
MTTTALSAPSDTHALVPTPVGDLVVTCDGRAVTGIRFGPPPPGAAAGPAIPPGPLATLADQLGAYFAGELRAFDVPLAPVGTAFQRRVWDALASIPYGETTTYGELAAEIGRPLSARAVGAANGANPLAIVVPCHRVIGADGTLTGYAGGLPAKRALLTLEGALPG